MLLPRKVNSSVAHPVKSDHLRTLQIESPGLPISLADTLRNHTKQRSIAGTIVNGIYLQ